MDTPQPDQLDKLRQAIEQLETQQRELGLDLQPQITELQQRLHRGIIASQSGSGAIAQAGGVAGGADSIVVGGNLYGDIYQVYQSTSGPGFLSSEAFSEVLNRYLGWVYQTYRTTRLYGMESLHGTPVRNLASVFVTLSLRRFTALHREDMAAWPVDDADDVRDGVRQFASGRASEAERVPMRRLLTLHPRLAIVGGAGSGKSTLLAFLAAHLAEHALQGGRLAVHLPTDHSALVPLVIPLRYYRDYEHLCEQSPQERLRDPRAGTLAGFIPWYLKRYSPINTADDFLERLLLGGGCLLLLDGLDEVVSRDARSRMRQQVEQLVHELYPGNPVLVTAREAGYREDAVFGDDFVRLDVQPLRTRQIQVLVARWCRELYPAESVSRTVELMAAIAEINGLRAHRDLPPLVSSPLMTTMVVSVKWGETELPRERAKLYEACIKVILQAQYIRDDAARESLVSWGGPWEEQRNWLSTLALAMHAGGAAGAVTTEKSVRAALLSELEPDQLEAFLTAVRYRGGLLEEKADRFQFLHLTFQEFLVARWLAKQRQAAWSTLQPHLTEEWWREVMLLTYGFAQMDHPPFARDYLKWLSTQDWDANHLLAGLELAGAALLELEHPNPTARAEQAQALLEALVDTELVVPALLRARAGNTLSRLGDPRFRSDLAFLPNDAYGGFIEIPAGSFWMGSSASDEDARDSEQPQHEVMLPTYWIARYPVTVAQFRAFVDSSGYQPSDADCLQGLANHPVVWVSWQDALAYCEWLTQYLQAAGGVLGQLQDLLCRQAFQVTLPSEAQWEKAARADCDRRRYPWGDGYEEKWVNADGSGIGRTSTVGCLPQGASPYGCQDMAGNVWEWTRTIWGESWDTPMYNYPYDGSDGREALQSSGEALRVLRGGSFNDGPQGVRCAVRLADGARGADGNVGFRVVLSALS